MPGPFSPRQLDSTSHRRMVLLCAALVVSLAMTSCGPVEFTHPLATPADTEWRGVWTGAWVESTHEGEQRVSRLEFDAASGGRWVASDSEGVFEVEIRPVRIGLRWFADLRVVSMRHRTERMSRDDWAVVGMMRNMYFVVRLDAAADSLVISYLWDTDVDALRRDHPDVLPTGPSKAFEGESAVTSSTQEIREFLARFGDVDSLFSDRQVFYRKR